MNSSAHRPFERMATPGQAIDRLAALYDDAASALRDAVERFLEDGVQPTREISAKFRYPLLRVIYRPEGVQPSSRRAFAKFPEAGIYTTTLTQPAAFRAYLLEQLEPLVAEFGATLEVGLSTQIIPYPYVFESGDELGRGGATASE
ncbi:MAG TPA: AMP nucleosidase, partial [Roseiarcus sp.]|nr:AMP nucleosidase [Roseiarcus sp.]